MNYLFMAKQTKASVNSLRYMLERNVNIVAAVVKKDDTLLREICEKNGIEICLEKNLVDYIAGNHIYVDYIISYYWKIIPPRILLLPSRGGINFHPGPLPEARGSGYHVAILNNWGYWGVTAHYMDYEYDTGNIIECRKFKIDNSILNKDLVLITQDHLFDLFKSIFDRLEAGEHLSSTKQAEGTFYNIKEIDKFKKIQDCDSLNDIHNKIRAFWNPPYTGATIDIKGEQFTVIDNSVLQWISRKMKELEARDERFNSQQ